MIRQANLSVILISVCTIAACGGGGSGDASTGITYTGKTTPASITISNGQTLVTESLMGGKTGSAIAASLDSESLPHGNGSRLLSLYKSLDTAMGKLDLTTAHSGNVLSAAQVNVKDTIPGTCATNPGNYSYNVDVNDATGEFSGSLSFNSYCDLGETMNGSTNFSGKFNFAKDDFDTFNINFTGLQDTTTTDSNTLSGTVAIDNTKASVQITMNLLNRDDHTGDVFKAENFIIMDTVATDLSYDDVTMQGRFYSPKEGYVDLSTPQPLHILAADDWPSSGELKATGLNNSSATLIALNNISYQVDIDTNGDNIPDSTTTGSWADL